MSLPINWLQWWLWSPHTLRCMITSCTVPWADLVHFILNKFTDFLIASVSRHLPSQRIKHIRMLLPCDHRHKMHPNYQQAIVAGVSNSHASTRSTIGCNIGVYSLNSTSQSVWRCCRHHDFHSIRVESQNGAIGNNYKQRLPAVHNNSQPCKLPLAG